MIQILPDHPAAVSPVKPDGLCVVRLTLADKGRHAGHRKAGFYKPESPAPNPSLLKCLLDVQRKQLRRVSLSQADIPGEPIRNPDKINGIGRIIDPLGVPFLVPGIIKAVDHLIRIDAPVCGRPNPPAKAWDHSCVRWFCRNKLHVVPILSLIPRRSFIPSPASDASGPALRGRSHGATTTGTRRRDRPVHMPVTQNRQRRASRPARGRMRQRLLKGMIPDAPRHCKILFQTRSGDGAPAKKGRAAKRPRGNDTRAAVPPGRAFALAPAVLPPFRPLERQNKRRLPCAAQALRSV